MKPTKAIFLDFDGVLSADPIRTHFDLPMIAHLNEIHAATGAGIVFSTSWRLSHSVDEMTALLRGRGLSAEVPILGATPILRKVGDTAETLTWEQLSGESELIIGTSRWREISEWLDAHPDVTDYCVIDDAIEAVCPPERAVECFWGAGLTDSLAQRAVAILKGEFT